MQIIVLGSGPGTGFGLAGAGHGGRAGLGDKQYDKTGSPYGMFNAPLQFGSGGSSCGGAGGGVLSLDIKQILNVEGNSFTFVSFCKCH